MTGRPRRQCLGLLLFAASCATGPASPGGAPSAGRPAAAGSAAGADHSETIASGVTWSRFLDAGGPWAIHVLHIDLEQCRPVLRAVKAGPTLVDRATTSALGSEALAAVNADFFELPGGRPVGAHVSGGEVLIGPGERPVLAATAAGLVQGTARIDGWVAAGPDTTRVRQVNRRTAAPEPPGGVVLWTGVSGTEMEGDVGLRVRWVSGSIGRGRGVVTGTVDRLAAGPSPDEWLIEDVPDWMSRLADGDSVDWDVRLVVNGSTAPALEAVGGFPTLMRDGRIVLNGNPDIRPDFGDRRHPRTAVGWNARSVFLVVVDGRQPAWSNGMTLAELAGLFQRLGARDAINLDGGGSSAMVVRGGTVNRPSDATGERAVGNALVLERCT